MADPSDLLIDRTLVLLRHAKAVPPESMPDLERPLAERGRADAAAAGRYLVAQGIEADLVLCSTSKRTRETWKYVAEGGATATDVWYDKRIYNADTVELLDVLREAPAEARTVVMIGHAPGIPWMADELARASTSPERFELTQKYPTSGLTVLRLTTQWADVAADDADLASYVVPRG
ncbi:phosphoglycolate phosphatase [Kribbella sandramycini]|uniref:Phosphoglycolate phosphatase n=1 Tax=Kribbella sandramycini TaxID=60450 RepID=A0A7Y4KVQ8_9ACTN|nr:histidine phosphatase family protein [Kribbella sandramycini]MBB6568550.1 phosphohistidine phosphatase [Kribbella sandramycini]NOL38862.1 phosphoglycolate phosphatase [Kribbella sandramycini]